VTLVCDDARPACRLACPACVGGGGGGPRGSYKGPPRSPQGPSRAPQGPPGGPWAPPRTPQGPPTKVLVSLKSAVRRFRSQREGLSLSKTWLPAVINRQFYAPPMPVKSMSVSTTTDLWQSHLLARPMVGQKLCLLLKTNSFLPSKHIKQNNQQKRLHLTILVIVLFNMFARQKQICFQ
jgi:hypothetical protein